MLAEASPEDYEFIHVPLLADAVKKLQSVKVDIVLLDLRLPDCNGVEAVRAVRETAGQVPIVVLTGTDDEQIALECIEAGAQDYLEKNETRALSLRRSIWYAITRVREAQMRELSEERMRFALQNAKAGLWDLDCTTGTVQLSELCEHQLGLQPGAFDGKMATFFDIVHPGEDRQLVSNSLQHSMLTEATYRWNTASFGPTERYAGRMVLGDFSLTTRKSRSAASGLFEISPNVVYWNSSINSRRKWRLSGTSLAV